MGLPQPGPWGLEATSTFVFAGDPNTHVTSKRKGDLCLDITTPALYIANAAASTSWAAVGGGGGGITSWGLESTSHFTHAGDPNAAVTAVAAGDLCIDTTNKDLYIAEGAGTVWTLVGPATFPDFTGSGSPEGVQTANVGQSYQDADTGALYFKFSGDATNTGWVIGTAHDAGASPGVSLSNNRDAQLLGGSQKFAVLSDVDGYNGTGNGAYWNFDGGADGAQDWRVVLGPAGEFVTTFAADGSTSFPGPATFGEFAVTNPMPPGVGLHNGQILVLGGPTGSAGLSDTNAQNTDTGTGNGLYWNNTGVDGDQSLILDLGPSDDFEWQWKADGSTSFPGPITTADKQAFELGNFVSVLVYGADPTGATDSAAAIQAANDAVDALTGGGALVFPNGSYKVASRVNQTVKWTGQNRDSVVILADPAFTDPVVVEQGPNGGTGLVFGCMLEDITVDANNTGALCVFSDQINEDSGLRGCVFRGCGADAAARYNGAGITTGGGAANFVVENNEFYIGNQDADFGLDLNHADSCVRVYNNTFNGDPHTFDRGLNINFAQVVALSNHYEHCNYGEFWTGSSQGTSIGAVGGPSLTNCVASDCNHVAVMSVDGNGATHTFVDGNNSVTVDDAFLQFYSQQQVTAARLGVLNAAAATLPGTVTKKVEIFDGLGASLGFVPVYDAIT